MHQSASGRQRTSDPNAVLVVGDDALLLEDLIPASRAYGGRAVSGQTSSRLEGVELRCTYSWGPAPCRTMGKRPSRLRNDSERARSLSSLVRMAPPILGAGEADGQGRRPSKGEGDRGSGDGAGSVSQGPASPEGPSWGRGLLPLPGCLALSSPRLGLSLDPRALHDRRKPEAHGDVLEDGKLGLGEDARAGADGAGRARKDTEVALDLVAGAERVEKA
jgi:hypothetical protein